MAIFLAVTGFGALLSAPGPTRAAGRLILWSIYIVAPVLIYLSTFREIAVSWIGVGVTTFAFSQLLHAIGKNSSIIRTPNGKGYLSITLLAFLGTLVLWPLLLAERVIDSVTPRKPEPVYQTVQPDSLPTEIEGTVSFAHHIGSEEGEEMVWLEEYGDQPFYLTTDAFEEEGLGEGAHVIATVVAESGERVGVKDSIFWLQSVKRVQGG